MNTPTLPPIQASDPTLSPEAAERLHRWRARYLDGLAGPYGWWSISALAWAGEGANLLGSEDGAALPLPKRGPARAAWLQLEGDRLRIEPVGGADLYVSETQDGEATLVPFTDPADLGEQDLKLQVGTEPDAIQVVVIRRFGRYGVRVYDPHQSAQRDRADGVAWFAPQPGFVVEAEFLPAETDEVLPIVNLLGAVTDQPVAGRLRFVIGGVPCTLVATASGSGLFVNFRDVTSGVSTYGAGRFLQVARPVEGRTIIDFHHAYHPPCAHTAHALCPLPPLENRLAVAIEAGERQTG